MKLHELAEYFGYTESSLKANYKRTVNNLAKKGIIIIKKGYGQDAEYYIKYKELQDVEKNR